MKSARIINRFTAMNLPTFFIIILFSSGICFGIDKPLLSEEKDKISYSVGYKIGEDLRKQKVDFDPAAFLSGVQDAASCVEPQFTEGEMQSTLMALKRKIVEQYKVSQVDKRASLRDIKEKYRGEGREFLADNVKKEGVVELPGGLQYKVIREGNGKKPRPNDTVLVHYRGTLIDGTEFDSSYKENKPVKFNVSGVIAGWKEALQLMNEGSKWQIFVPADLAYGERGPLADRTVIFDLELISVEAAK